MSRPSASSSIRLATRASRLALWQAEHVTALLQSCAPDVAVEIVEISTIGDRDRSTRLAEMGGQGVFTKEVQAAVLDGRADVAVHSLKDLPTDTAPGLLLAGVPTRGPRWDVLLLPERARLNSLDELPQGARVATGSLRRQSQLRHARPDLQMCEVRGNVETRLRKLDEREFDVLVLAEAGLERLGLADRISWRMSPPLMFPAVGQAALGLECREDDARACELLSRITHAETLAEVLAERSCLRTLRAGCHAPVGTLAAWDAAAGTIGLQAVVLSPDGGDRIAVDIVGAPGSPEEVGREAAERLWQAGAERLLRT